MKRISLYCLLLLFLSTMVACQGDNEENVVLPGNQGQNSALGNLTATISDGLYNNWCAGDVIMLLHGGKTVFVEAQESGNMSGLSSTVEGTFTDDNPLYGIFPADNMVSSDNESVIITIPTAQTGGDNGYDEKSAVTVARTVTKSLNFHTICGGIKLNFQMSGVTRIELESVDGYALSGMVRIKWDEQGKPVVDEIESANSIITFNASEDSGLIPGKDYYISTLPCDIYGGYRLSIYKDDLVAHYFGVHQMVDRSIYISPSDLHESELEFDNPDAPLVEEERPELDAITNILLHQYQRDPTEENKQALLDQMGLRYDKVVARKKAKLRELEREAKTPDLVEEMQGIVDEMVEKREIRLEQQFLRLIDPRNDDNPDDAWMVLRGASALNAYIGYAPVTNAEYAVFREGFIYDTGKENYPVVNVTIAEVTAYCDWLTAHDNSHTYRLPTDEEWVLAAGHMPKDVSMNSGHVESGLTAVDAYSQTTGACGGTDFWGNCWEWTSSTDASGSYIVKGGSWDSERDDCRSEKSDVVRTGTLGYTNVGFRVVRVDSSDIK
ncbi:SUMF1/EgtB/PvdO family nonheme iron enzyme [Bacteroides sp. GM023]|uniref:formylglycine-generating enzyme family protein n=1 Tax=Bacteroides sp. GM023 TaxID=2723058 RepID=UPI001CC32A48|nr:SUMF1/EgtB/PvdO family nonheme iron enzyme [Bacteroides sp. GM023]